ncbi:MAG: GAF domain-containing protein [Syntrophaceae bacterium]|nr:GAF domain-containing protein [Syntrophaceae bacterium]
MAIPMNSYDLLKSIVQLSMTSFPISIKLDRMVQSISEAFPSARCLLLKPEEITRDGFLFRLASEKEPLWVEDGSSFQKENVLPEEESFLYPSFACIPLNDETTSQGILYLGFPKPHPFSPEEVELLLLIGEVMAGVIQNEHLYQKAEETISELKALHEMGKAVASTLKLENLFPLIVTTGLKILKAKGGVLRIEDKRTKELKLKWSVGNYHQHPLDEKIAKRVFYTQTPLFFNHFGEEKPSFSILCAPFLSQGQILGTLAFYDKDSDASKFDKKDFQLFLMMVNQLSLAMENALTHYEISNMAQENEKRVAQLSTLWELNKALLTTVHFERILHLTLTAITIGEGLKFNRAMLFLVNEKDRLLQGAIAVGPDSAEEAGKIWDTLSREKGPLSDRIAQFTSPNHSHLNEIVKGIRIPLEKEQCILSRTVLEGKPFNIQSHQSKEGGAQIGCDRGCRLGSEVGCYVGEHLSRDPKVYSFATVPLMGKGKVIGVILVDNLYNQNPITEEDIHFLSMFSNQAGLAIENAMLYRNLEQVHDELKETQNLLIQREKMVALGELSNSIAHEIKNPLVSIGGFARRLYRTIPDDTMEKQYTQTIMTEVARVEKILTDIFNYTHDESMAFKPCNLRNILEESLSLTQEKIAAGKVELVKDFSEEIPQINGDSHQLRQVFSNLIHNAYQAMKGEGKLSLRLHSIAKNGTSYVEVEIADTGGGIDPENLHNIFNPFYTTKDKSLGLGLPIVHKIITSHRGQIEVDNHPGKGVNFIITLPASEQGRESRCQMAEDHP